ncbi:MAG: hypothetical protein OWP43_04385 [Sphaerochaetaceae bacterium]|nr:hypothetical protein [Sphaerochaetaceae bacterium]
MTTTKKGVKFPSSIKLVLFLVLFTASALLTMFQPIWANIPLNIIIPALLLMFMEMVFFERLKLSTLICMRLLVVVTVFGLFSGPTCVKIVLVLWMINILEATITDLSKKHYLNAITGFVLTLSLFTFFTQQNLSSWNGVYYSLFFNGTVGTICWIISYTLWNWDFVSYDFPPSIAKLHLAVLASPIVGALITSNPGLWFILRGNSLTTAGVTEIAFKKKIDKSLESERMTNFVEKVHTFPVQLTLMILNVLLVAVPALVL